MSANVRRYDDAGGVTAAAATQFRKAATAALAAHGAFRVALSGGSTPRPLYELLAAEPHRSAIAWKRVDFFWGDERPVPPGHPDSNFGMVRAALLDEVPADPARIHRIEAERADRDEAARAYQAEIAGVFGVPADGSPPAFDLVLLGLGPDGHTASLFPGTAALAETTRWVVAQSSPGPHDNRVTLTAPILNEARRVIFLVAGASKASALAAVLEGDSNPQRWPAQLIRPTHGELLWLVDRAAAAGLHAS